MKTYATNISWETDGETIDLPIEIEIPDNIAIEYQLSEEDDTVIGDWLSNTYGWLHNGFDITIK